MSVTEPNPPEPQRPGSSLDGGAETFPSGEPPGEEAPLLRSREGPVLLLTLHRPHRLNAVSPAMYGLLEDALEGAEADASVRAVVLTGAGRAFSVGADLKAHGEAPLGPAERRAYVETAQRVNRRVQTLGVPVLAAVNGHAVGAGLELALSADLVVVSREAKLRFPEVALGTFVGGGVTYTLPQRVGRLRAAELLLLADFFSGEQAAAWGLANQTVEAAEVLPATLDMARRLASHAPLSLQLAKRLLLEASTREPAAALEAEVEALLRCMQTLDWEEGIRAFHEKRDPRFTGR